MARYLKTTGYLLAAILLLVLLSIGLLITFVNPNKLKPIISSQVLKYTGRQLTIDGDLSWSFFPYLGVKVGHMTLNNPAGFKQASFAEINHATVGVKLLPLLHKQIQTNGIKLNGVKLNLTKNEAGLTNWQNWRPLEKNLTTEPSNSKIVVSQKHSPEVAVVPAQTLAGKRTLVSFDIPSVDVSDSQITWLDEQTKQLVKLNNMELHAKNINIAEAFPVKASFDFSGQPFTMAGQVSFDGQVTLNLDKQVYLVKDMTVSAKLHQKNKEIDAQLHGILAIDLPNQKLSLRELVAHTANLTTNGAIDISHLQTNPFITGRFQTKPFDLKQLLNSFNQNISAIQTANDVRAEGSFSYDTTLSKNMPDASFAALQGVKFQGKVQIGDAKVANLKMTQFAINTTLRNRTLELTPMTANLYQGNLQAQAKLILAAGAPQLMLQAKLNNVQVEPLLQDLGRQNDKLKIKGEGNIALQLTTSGLNSDMILRNLNGNSQFSFKNGQLSGVNIGYLIDSAHALVQRKSIPVENENVTHFGTLTGTAVIQNGVITNKDLFIDSPRFSTGGQGIINLVNQQLNYQLQIMSKQHDPNDQNPLSLNNLAIPVRIAGSFSNPSIRLDGEAIAQMVAKQQIKQVENKLKERIHKQIPGEAGALIQNLLGN